MQQTEKRLRRFQPLGDGLARKEKRIYARVKVNRRYTWLSTKTNVPSLARRWKDHWDKRQWARTSGLLPEEDAARRTNKTTFNQLADLYEQAGRPIVRKRALRPKSPRSIRNETYYIRPLREYFGDRLAADVTLADCDLYHAWRISGSYVSTFLVRGRQVQKRNRGGSRLVDLELGLVSNIFAYAVRRGLLKSNPIAGRGRFGDPSLVRHCRDVSTTPSGLERITQWLAQNGLQQDADITHFLAYSGLRVSEALALRWSQVDWEQQLIHVKRGKKGVFPFVVILPEMAGLLNAMKPRAAGDLIFPGPFTQTKARDYSSYRRRLEIAARKCGLPHVTPHGLRSYFVTQARQSGLTDAEIAQLIGDKTGPTLIAQVYGDVRPDHLLAVARKIQLTARTRADGVAAHPNPNPANHAHDSSNPTRNDRN